VGRGHLGREVGRAPCRIWWPAVRGLRRLLAAEGGKQRRAQRMEKVVSVEFSGE
jgi:hypothetical protein